MVLQNVPLAITIEIASFCLELHSLCWKRAFWQLRMPMYFTSAHWFLRFVWAPVDNKYRSPAQLLVSHTGENSRNFSGIKKISYVTCSVGASSLNWNLLSVLEDLVFTQKIQPVRVERKAERQKTDRAARRKLMNNQSFHPFLQNFGENQSCKKRVFSQLLLPRRKKLKFSTQWSDAYFFVRFVWF